MRFTSTIAAAALLSIAAGCSNDDSTSSAATEVTVPATVEEISTTSVAASTTTTEAVTTTTKPKPTTTTIPKEGVVAAVWESAVDPERVNQVDPPPTFSVDGVTVTLQLVMYIPADNAGPFRDNCASELEFLADPAIDHCLLVQLSMDVAADFKVDEYSEEAGVSVDALITPAGKQYSSVFATYGYPGTVDNTLSVVIGGGEPGSTLKISTGSNSVGWTTSTFVLPGIEAFGPATWL